MPLSCDAAFSYRSGVLHCEDVDLERLARSEGTPAYVYSAGAIRQSFQAYEEALAGLPHRVCFAVKANSNLAVLSLLVREGAGFDIVSGGELFRVVQAGGNPESVVFSGVGKTEEEIRYALSLRIHSFNCESEAEIALISRIATAMEVTASIAIRVNPDVDAATHPYISTGLREHKFGVDIGRAREIYQWAAGLPGISAQSVSCHIGSQLLEAAPMIEAADKIIALADDLRSSGLPIEGLDLGGGLGVPYRSGDQAPPISAFVDPLRAKIAGKGYRVTLEPGRSIVAQAGILLSRVLLRKRNGERTFVVVDAAMNDLLRPSLYQAHHEITPVREVPGRAMERADIVGPVCESGDFFARDRELPQMEAGELVALRTTGAYGFVLASNYNSRPRVCELLIDGNRIHVARRRETFEDLIHGESALAEMTEDVKGRYSYSTQHDELGCDFGQGSS